MGRRARGRPELGTNRLGRRERSYLEVRHKRSPAVRVAPAPSDVAGVVDGQELLPASIPQRAEDSGDVE